MNKQDVIDWYMRKFEQKHDEKVPDEIKALIEQDAKLKAEIETLQSFYETSFESAAPSMSLDEKFTSSFNAQKLAAQSAQENTQVRKLHAQKASNDSDYRAWFSKVASFAIIFVLGLFLGSKTPSTDNGQLAKMQNDLAELNALVAMTMLQTDNASQRLAAVSFTQKADVKSDGLVNAMLESLKNESSTAVKLALIRSFYDVPMENIESALIEIALEEEHQLVQIAISQLILKRSSAKTQKQFISAMRQRQAEKDVIEFLEQYESRMRI